MTGFGDAITEVTIGAGSVTVTIVVPLTVPLVAMTVAVPLTFGAVYKPVALTVPMPALIIDQVNVGCVVNALPNWSFPVAVSCCVSVSFNVGLAGVTTIVVNV